MWIGWIRNEAAAAVATSAANLQTGVRRRGCNGPYVGVAMPEVVLHRAQIRALVRKIIAAGMAQHATCGARHGRASPSRRRAGRCNSSPGGELCLPLGHKHPGRLSSRVAPQQARAGELRLALTEAGPVPRHEVPLMSVPRVEIEICEAIEHLKKALMTVGNRPHPRVRHVGNKFVQTP